MPAREPDVRTESLILPVGQVSLSGDLSVPSAPRGLVVFAHGSGSSRRSTRNRYVAELLRGRQLATLLFDLLSPDEERRDAIDGRLRFDIPMLAGRLIAVTDWIREHSSVKALPLGYFGASTGAAAALMAAAERPAEIAAVVSRGGRPDLARAALARVRAPTLLIVGGADTVVLGLNRDALALLQVHKQLAVVPGATHLFEETGALEQVARHAGDWFAENLWSVSPSTESPSLWR